MNRRSFIGAVSALFAGIKLAPTCPVPAVNPRIGLSGQLLAMRNGRPQWSDPFIGVQRMQVYTTKEYREAISIITEKDLNLGLSAFYDKSDFQNT